MTTVAELISYPCSIDGSMQKAMYFRAKGSAPRPLLVALHTWSADCSQSCENYLGWCVEKNWHMIFPEFRGPNWNVDGCGSDKVIADIADAVAFVKGDVAVDDGRVYLVGGSGGGHCTLLLAGTRPELWTAASAWCPISDVAAWHRECLPTEHKCYAEHIESACGGNPAQSAAALAEAKRRSPLTYLKHAANLPLDINTGIHDGHIGSVPVTHAIRAFNLLAKPEDRISEADMQFIAAHEAMPEHLLDRGEADPSFGERKIWFRRSSNNARLTIFEGGHDLVPDAALGWLEKQTRGNAPDWTPAAARQEGNEVGLGR